MILLAPRTVYARAPIVDERLSIVGLFWVSYFLFVILALARFA